MIVSRSLASLSRFLLESVEHVHNVGKTDGVDRSEGVSIEVVHDLQHATAAEALQRLGSGMLAALLHAIEGFTEDGKVRGRYVASGFVPRFYDELQRRGIPVNMGIFREE